MSPLNEARANDSGSDDEKSSASGSDSESESESKSGSRSRSQSRSGRQSAASGSGSSAKSIHSPDQASSSRSRSGSAASRSSSDDNDGNLVLDEKKQSRSPTPNRSSSSASSASKAQSHKSDEEENDDKDSAKSPSESNKEAKKKSKRILDSDADSDASESKRDQSGVASPTADALFGDADDISSGDDEEDANAEPEVKKASVNKIIDSDREEDMDQDERGDHNKEPEEIVPETKIEHEIPYIRADVGKELHFVKLPNFLSVDPRPFDSQTYEDELEEEETMDEEGRARLKLKVENTIRWRTAFDDKGNAIQESNARMVRWSDGSLTLHLGSEIFDVFKQPLQGDHNHLFIRQGTGLQGQAVFKTKLTFRPHSTESFTHRKMTKSLAERSTKTSAIKIIGTVGHDPDAHRGEMIKKEEERLRASVRRESKQKRVRERTATGRSMSGSYLEPDRDGYDDSEDEGAGISLSAIKNKYKRGGGRDSRPPIYSSDDDASDIDTRKGKKLEKAKTIIESENESDEDDSDGKKKSSKIRVDDSSSEEESD